MSVAEAVVVVVVLAVGATLISGAGWLVAQTRPRAEARHYATISQMEATLAAQQQRHDAAMLAMERRLDAAIVRQDALEVELEAERESRRQDHARVTELMRLIEAWMQYARQLADIIRRELKTEPPPEPERPADPAPARRRNGVALARRIAEGFSLEEIDELAFELGLDGTLTGETLQGRASSLVMAAGRRHLTERLVGLVREKRPGER